MPLVLGVGLATWLGWREFWFLTDDAFIAFRYASNALLGYGLVWNPPPFAAVEGYTSFLWVRLLEWVWRLTGVAPPRSANWISLTLGFVTLWWVARLFMRMALPPALERHRPTLLALVMLGTVSNPTFLAWLSSGLETALFNLGVTWWLVAALAPAADRGTRWLVSLSCASAVLALTRPDGLLFAAAWGVLVLLHLRERGGADAAARLALAPMLAVPVHLVWRRVRYGLWLPNTYYAKHVEPWAESGVRYLASFLLEYGVWVWGLLMLAWVVKRLRAGALPIRPFALLAIGTAVAHVAYYTLVIGGDHFEYRVYSPWIPLLFVSAVWLGARVFARPVSVVAAVVAFILASWPIPWVHWFETRELSTRGQTLRRVHPIAERFPAALRPPVQAWDDWQAWLARRRVCVRHQEHKVFAEHQLRELPTRAEGSAISWDERAVIARGSVGIVSWVLPHVAVIDEFGLNDRVVARNPSPRYDPRRMGHDRMPPPGYVECFRPNLSIEDGSMRLESRARPLLDDEIRACEAPPS